MPGTGAQQTPAPLERIPAQTTKLQTNALAGKVCGFGIARFPGSQFFVLNTSCFTAVGEFRVWGAVVFRVPKPSDPQPSNLNPELSTPPKPSDNPKP